MENIKSVKFYNELGIENNKIKKIHISDIIQVAEMMNDILKLM